MDEIKPRIDEDGEPWCWTGCPSFAGPEDRDLDCRTCQIGSRCIPVLRQQRDEARAENKRLLNEGIEVIHDLAIRAEKAEAEVELLRSRESARNRLVREWREYEDALAEKE